MSASHRNLQYAQEEIPGAYPLRAIVRHGQSSVSGESPIRIITPPEQWAYAASIPLQIDVLPLAFLSADPVLLSIKATAEDGRVGVGLIQHDQRTFVGEAHIDASVGTAQHFVVFGPLSSGASLMVRNTSDRGLPSVVLLDEPRAFKLRLPPMPNVLEPPANLRLVAMPGWNRYYGSGVLDLDEQIRAWHFARLTAPKPMPWLSDLQLMIYPRAEIYRVTYISGLYEPNSMVVASALLPEGGVFVDIGANIGLFSLVAARKVGVTGRVFSFEPSSRDFQRLVENLELNNLRNVKASSLAIADAIGTATLTIAHDVHSGHNTIGHTFGYPGIHAIGSEQVPTAPLDHFLESHHVDRLDLVKLDVEGSELTAFLGMRSALERLRPSIMFEVFEAALKINGASVNALECVLREQQYSLWDIDDRTARLTPLPHLSASTSENIVALPVERQADLLTSSGLG